MSRRRRGQRGQPSWLDNDIYELIKGYRMERLEPPKGYVLATKQTVEEIIAVEAELLRSEGIDPRWHGFPDDQQEPDDKQ